MKIQTSVKLTIDECVNLAVERLKEVYGEETQVEVAASPSDSQWKAEIHETGFAAVIRETVGTEGNINKIAAIKAVREWFNDRGIMLGLGAAKLMVELYTMGWHAQYTNCQPWPGSIKD